jgi:hypothetical protein
MTRETHFPGTSELFSGPKRLLMNEKEIFSLINSRHHFQVHAGVTLLKIEGTPGESVKQKTKAKRTV